MRSNKWMVLAIVLLGALMLTLLAWQRRTTMQLQNESPGKGLKQKLRRVSWQNRKDWLQRRFLRRACNNYEQNERRYQLCEPKLKQ